MLALHIKSLSYKYFHIFHQVYCQLGFWS